MADNDSGAVIDDHAIVEFTCGACGYLAVVLHDATGWPIYCEYEKHPHASDIAHIWVIDPSGNGVDINGIHVGPWAKTKYSDAKPGQIAQIARAQAIGDDEGFHEWARDIVASNPEHFGIPSPSQRRVASAPVP